nr:PREDICTED: uncharacterized protein LOC108951149 [Musa acuminata subsp. malaccensis]
MTVIEPDPVLEENPIANNVNVEGSVEEKERLLDGGFVVLGSNACGHSFRERKKSNSGRVLPCQSHLPNICYMDLSYTTFFLTVMISVYAKSSIRSWIRFERSKLFRCLQRQTSKDTGFHCFSFDVVVTQLLRLRRAIIRSYIF